MIDQPRPPGSSDEDSIYFASAPAKSPRTDFSFFPDSGMPRLLMGASKRDLELIFQMGIGSTGWLLHELWRLEGYEQIAYFSASLLLQMNVIVPSLQSGAAKAHEFGESREMYEGFCRELLTLISNGFSGRDITDPLPEDEVIWREREVVSVMEAWK